MARIVFNVDGPPVFGRDTVGVWINVSLLRNSLLVDEVLGVFSQIFQNLKNGRTLGLDD